MPLYEAECTALAGLFNALPSDLPSNPTSSSLPPHINAILAKQNGPWEAFNKAMHATFGDKSNGLKIHERGVALTETITVIRWVLAELEGLGDVGSASLVKLWIDALMDAAKAAGAKSEEWRW